MKTLMTKTLAIAIAAAATLASSGVAWAQNAVQSVAAANQAGRVVFRAEFAEPLTAVPPSFSVASPARIAFDLVNTSNATGKPSVAVNEGELRSVSLVQVGGRTRLVLNLSSMMTYETKVEGKTLEVVLTSNVSAISRGPGQAERFAEDRSGNRGTGIKDVDFRRGPAGEGRIVVDLTDSRAGIDIRQQGPNLVIDFIRTSLPESLRRRLNVTDFGTPVQTLNVFTQGANARIMIEPKGNWEHTAYQTDTQFVVEVKPVAIDPNKLTQGSRAKYNGEKLSLNFQNIDVRSVLNVIADFTDLNIITSDTVQGNLTLRLKDVPWDQALDIILQTRGLDLRKNGNVLWIAPRDELATKEKLELEARNQIADLEPLRTETFQLNYTKATEISKILRDDKQRIMSKRGSVVVDPRTNQMFVQDISSQLDEIRRVVARVDVPVRQVMIEARIVEADDRFARTLGVRLGVAGGGAALGGRYQTGGNLRDAAFPNQIATPIPNFSTDRLNVALPARGLTGVATETPGQLALVLFSKGLSRFLNLELSALEADVKGKIISSPRVITADQTEANIEQGTEIPFQQATSSGATSIAFRKAVLALKVKPQITPDGNVIMDIEVNKDAVSSVTSQGAPAIDTKRVRTTVRV